MPRAARKLPDLHESEQQAFRLPRAKTLSFGAALGFCPYTDDCAFDQRGGQGHSPECPSQHRSDCAICGRPTPDAELDGGACPTCIDAALAGHWWPVTSGGTHWDDLAVSEQVEIVSEWAARVHSNGMVAVLRWVRR